MATQVKLYIEPDQEIRRFTLDGKATYEQLRQQVEGLVGHASFRILWLDSEKDFIVLGSADELAAAKEGVTNGLLRLFVRPTVKPASLEKKKVHNGVTCDGCQGIVAGTRYKCLECADFDLCEECQAKGAHQQHDMLTIRRPRTLEWKKLFMQGYGSRESGEGRSTAERGPDAEGGCPRRPCGGSARGPGYHQRGHPMCGPFGGPGPFGGSFRGPTGFPFGGPFAGGPPPMCRGAFARRQAAAADQTVEMDLNINRPVADIISDITQKVMGAIHKAQAAQEEKAEAAPQTEEEKKVEQEQVAAVNEIVTAVAETVTVVADAVNEFVEELSKTESENGWTHLESEPVEEKSKPQAEKTDPQDEKAVKDQRIESALRAMEEMGFPSEGSLLRRLLENYNGDIARVLDSIK